MHFYGKTIEEFFLLRFILHTFSTHIVKTIFSPESRHATVFLFGEVPISVGKISYRLLFILLLKKNIRVLKASKKATPSSTLLAQLCCCSMLGLKV